MAGRDLAPGDISTRSDRRLRSLLSRTSDCEPRLRRIRGKESDNEHHEYDQAPIVPIVSRSETPAASTPFTDPPCALGYFRGIVGMMSSAVRFSG